MTITTKKLSIKLVNLNLRLPLRFFKSKLQFNEKKNASNFTDVINRFSISSNE